MATKLRIPKKIAGYKVPKSVRKSKFLKMMLNNPLGRDVLANALTAGAGAAAAVLVQNRNEIGQAGKQGAQKGLNAAGLAVEAAQSAATAMIGVVREAGHSFLPESKEDSDDDRKRPKKPAVN